MKSIIVRTGLAIAVALTVIFLADSAAQATDVPYGYSTRTVPPAKGEISRTEIFNKKKELVSVLIDHQNGSMETRTLNPDGSMESKHVTDAAGKSSDYTYYPDGKLKLEVKDGVRRFQRRKLADGTYEAIRYKEDGKRLRAPRRNTLPERGRSRRRAGKKNRFCDLCR